MQPSDLSGLDFTDTGRRVMRATLAAGGLCIAYGAAAGAVVGFGSVETKDGVGLFLAVTAVLGLSFALAMFGIALAALFAARAADRAIAGFRRGDSLADWSFAQPEWDAFLASEATRRAKARFWILALAVIGPIAIVLAIVVWLLAPDLWVRVASVALVAGGNALALWLVLQLCAAFDRRRFAMMRRNRRVLIGSTAIYCGGMLTLWGVGMTVLQRVRLVAGNPMVLEVTTGAGAAVRTAGTLAAFASVAAGGATGGAAASNVASQARIPVPAGREDEAAQVVQALLHPPARQAASVQVTPPQARPEAAAPKRSWHWWTITAGLLVAGLALLLTGARQVGPDGADTGLGTAMDVTGLLLWIASIPTAITAALASFRSIRHRAARSG